MSVLKILQSGTASVHFKMLRKVSAAQTDEQNITFIQMVEGKPVESKVPKNIIVDIYAIVCNLHRY